MGAPSTLMFGRRKRMGRCRSLRPRSSAGIGGPGLRSEGSAEFRLITVTLSGVVVRKADGHAVEGPCVSRTARQRFGSSPSAQDDNWVDAGDSNASREISAATAPDDS